MRGKAAVFNNSKAKANGFDATHGSVDVEMADPPPVNGATGSESDSEEEEDGSGMAEDKTSSSDEEDASISQPSAIVSIDRIAVSTDGQWLATSDNRGRTHIFHLDSISVCLLNMSSLLPKRN